jgi:hypothetical protein
MDYLTPKPTQELVQERIEDVNTITKDAMVSLVDFLSALKSSVDINLPYIHPDYNHFTPIDINIDAEKPEKLDPETVLGIADLSLEVSQVTAPTRPELDDIIDSIDDIDIDFSTENVTLEKVSVPSFTEGMPTITTPLEPSEFSGQMPSEPTVNEITKPNAPILDGLIPEVPHLETIIIPEFDGFTMPTFEGVLPSTDFFDNLDITKFEYSEPAYSSPLKDAITSKLEGIIEADAGLGASVEEAIWTRQQERNEIALTEAIETLIDTWSSRPWKMPNGPLQASIEELVEKNEYARVDSSREVMVKQAELAQQNTQHALSTGVNLEQITSQYASSVAERALKASIATVEMGISIINARIAMYNGRLEAYKASASVYDTLVKAEGLKVEVYKSLLEGVKLEANIQEIIVALYKEQMQAVLALVDIYKTEMEAARIESEIERVKIEKFREQVNAFNSLVNAKVAEYGLYKSKLEGEQLKVQVYGEQVKTFQAQLEGVKISSDINIEQSKMDIETERMRLDGLKAELEKYKVKADTHFEKVKAITSIYGADTTMYNAQVNSNDSFNKILLEKYKTLSGTEIEKIRTLISMYNSDAQIYSEDVRKGEANARLQLEQSRILEGINNANIQVALQAAIQNLNSFLELAKMDMSVNETGSKVYGGFVSAALQAINASMQIGNTYQHQGAEHVGYNYSGQYDTMITDLPEPKASL